ncbi:sigma-70 family RNA polymerase sigma factor [uncultured Meiothermus sp.]|uniref:RNA polymerase sigma factor n=1 Tax=uncultured Meiothermus sp. TaxID=157471 RepID=UPI002618BBA6|nr:sigma-70 family RNA polymerase sigma factor [uncultured Meiothermus sp.]
MEPDIDLMSRLAKGDERALAELYRRYSPSLYALLLRMLQSREEAEEILQDSFVQLYREAARYQLERGSVTAFLFTIGRHFALSRLRSRGARPQKVDDRDLHNPEQELGLWREDDPTDRILIRRALHRLEPTDRKLLEEAFFDGYSHSELAERHHLPLGTVKTRVRRALLKLREYLGGPQTTEEA